MTGYAARRILGMASTLLVLLSLTFFLLRLAPGGPFDSDRAWPAEIQRNIESRYGLDRPLPVQLGVWLKDVFRGDLRESFHYIGKPVTEIIGETLPVSLQIGFSGLILALVIGIPLGVLAGWKQNTAWDFSAMFTAMAGVSLPSYLVASLLILVFALWLGWFPPALWEDPLSIVLPMITIAVRPAAMIARLTRASFIEAFRMDYVRTAYAKGLPEGRILFKHVLRNALIPVITLIGPLTANLITGSFVVETVFQLPGLGKYFVFAVLNRDYPLVMGTTIVYGVILLTSNLMVDLAYAWIDPRVRLR